MAEDTLASIADQQPTAAEDVAPEQTPGTPPPAPKPNFLEQTYRFLKEQKIKGVSEHLPANYQEFEQGMLGDPDNVKALHSVFKDQRWEGSDLPDAQFADLLLGGLKKKDPAAGSPPSVAGSPRAGAPTAGPAPAPTATDPSSPPPVADQAFTNPADDVAPIAGGPAAVGVGDVPAEVAAAPSPGAELPTAGTPAPAGLVEAQGYPAYLAAHPEEYQKAVAAEQPTLDPVPDGYERVPVPATAIGPDEVGTYQAPRTQTGQRYIDRPLSKEVPGEGEQGLGLAALRNTNNLIADGFKGLLTAADDASQLISSATGFSHGGLFGKGAQALETTKKPVAPYYQSPDFMAHPNAKNLLMATSDVAGMAIPLVAQALAPEAGLGATAARVFGTGAGLMFDGQILQGAHDKAVAAGMSPDQVAAYTFLEGGLSVALFKGGGALLGKVGGQLTPEAVKSEIMRETYRLLADRGGRQLTRAELQGVLQQATAAATPRLLKAATEGGKMGALFGVNEAKNILTEAAARQTIGAKFTAPTLSEAVKRVVGATTEGVFIGGATGAATPSPRRTLPLGRTPDGRTLAAEVNEAGDVTAYRDEAGAPVDFGKAGPPAAVQQATQTALAAAPAPLATEQVLSHQKVEVLAHRSAGKLFADFDTQGKPVRLYNEQGQVFSLDDPQIRAQVEAKWPGAAERYRAEAAAKKTKGDERKPGIPAASTSENPAPASETPTSPAVVDESAPKEIAPLPDTVAGQSPAVSPTSMLETPPAPARTFYAGAGENPRVDPAKTSGADLPQLGLAITPDPADPTKATFTLNPANVPRLLGDGLRSVGQFFDYNLPTGKIQGVATRTPGKLELRDGTWHVVEKGAIHVQDGQPDTQPQSAAPGGPTGAGATAADGPRPTASPTEPAAVSEFDNGGVAGNSEPPAPAARMPTNESTRDTGTGQLLPAGMEENAAAVSKPYGTPAENRAAGENTEVLPAASPHPDHVTTLTPEKQAANNALDALDRYNALDKRGKKGKPGSEARADISRAAKQAGLEMVMGADYGVTVTRAGKRVTRTNEYTGTTPAANHVPLTERPAAARPFLENVIAAAESSPTVVQGIGVEIRGKPLSADELAGAVKDIQAGKNTMRAQLVLDALENAHNRGYVEKSEGNGLSTRKYTVPVDEYVGKSASKGEPRELTDPELDVIYESDPQAKKAVDDYTFSDGSIDYAKLASDEPGLPFLFDVSDETATKLAQIARERAQQSTQPTRASNSGSGQPGTPTSEQPINPVDTGSAPESDARVDEVTPAGGAEIVDPLSATDTGQLPAGPTEAKKAEIRADIDAASARIKARRAERQKQGRVLSSVLGIGEIDPEDLRDAVAIAKGHVQLGVLGIKSLITQIRAAGLDEDAASDAALTPHLRELLTGEAPPELPANEPEGSETRRSMDRLLADPSRPEALKERVRDAGLDRYEPKTLAETREAVDDYMQRNSLAEAYAEAISTSDQLTGDVRTALRVRVLDAVGEKLTAALDAGDTAAADAYLEQSYKVAEALAKRGTDAGREINAYKLLVTYSPEAAVYQAQKEVADQRTKAENKLTQKASQEARAVRAAKADALDHALATPAVRQVRERVAGKTSPTTRERRAEIRAERASLFDQLRNLAKPKVAYSTLVPLTPEQVQAGVLHVKIFRTYIQEGIVRTRELVERLKKEGGSAVAGTPDALLNKQAAAALGDHQEAIRQGTAALGTTLDKIARDHLRDPAAVGKSLAEQFVAGAGLDPAEAKAYSAAIEQEFSRRIAVARDRRLAALDKRAQATTAKRAQQTDLDKTRELFSLAPTDDAAILDHLKRVNDLPELTTQDVAELRKLAQAVQAAPEGFQRDAAVEQLLKRQAQIKGVNLADIGSSLWYANVLSGPKTHAINLTANLLQTGSELGVATTHALLTGKGRYAGAAAKGLIKGLGRGAREAASVLATGRQVSRAEGKYEMPAVLENIRFAGGAANPVNYLKYVGRALSAGDVLFSSGLKEMRAHELAIKYALEDAKSDGTPGQDIWARAAETLYHTRERLAEARQQAQDEGLRGNDLERRVYELAEQGRDAKLTDEAREYGTAAVYNGEMKGGLGIVGNKIQQMTNDLDIGGVKPAKFLIPFVRVVTNVANAYLDYTPIGLARAAKGSSVFGAEGSAARQNYSRDDRQRLLIKSVVGGAVLAGAYALSHQKDEQGNALLELSGNGTGDPSKDASLRADGWQPYSLRVRGSKTWISYANHPLGIMLAVVGNANDGEKYKGELISDEAGAFNSLYLNSFRAMQFTKDMSALKGAADFLDILNSKNPTQITSWADRFSAGTVKGFVPWSSFLTQTAKDYEMLRGEPRKQGRSFAQMLYQDIPVARDGVHDALDVLGDPIAVDTDRLFSNPPHRDEPTQRLWNWLDKNKLFINVPNRSSGGALVLRAHQGKETPMTDAEYYRFMRERGQILKGFLQLHIGRLEKLDAKVGKKVLSKYSAAANRVAKARVFGPGAAPIDDN